jgi:multiple sugar transport system permease protein
MQTNRKPLRFYLWRSLLYLLIVATSLIMLVPFYWSLSTSFKLEQFVYANPPQWIPNPINLKSYQYVLTGIKFSRYLFNSLFVAGMITLGHVFFDTLAAYAFAKLKFPGRDKIFFIFLLVTPP